jgi:hypothetical protein
MMGRTRSPRQLVGRLSLDKMLSGVNALEINDIQEGRTEARLGRTIRCNNVTWR